MFSSCLSFFQPPWAVGFWLIDTLYTIFGKIARGNSSGKHGDFDFHLYYIYKYSSEIYKPILPISMEILVRTAFCGHFIQISDLPMKVFSE
jgi:hypothetical protein